MELVNSITVDYIFLYSNSNINLNGSIYILNIIYIYIYLVLIRGESSICTMKPFNESLFVYIYIYILSVYSYIDSKQFT